MSTAVIMAGGVGTRFWPASRRSLPKQFLPFGDEDKSLLRITADRIAPVVGEENVICIGSEQHRELLNQHVPSATVFFEPVGRNTAPPVLLAALQVDPSDVLVVLCADHYIADEDRFREVVQLGIEHAEKNDDLITMGITPNSPHTGYGYIRVAEGSSGDVMPVSEFVEKPDLETAVRYLDQGGYYWNSGMFIWRAEVILAAFEKYMPELYELMLPLKGKGAESQLMSKVFERISPESIDYGILEKADNVVTVPSGDIGWSDVGSWDAWAKLLPADESGNVLRGDAHVLDCSNSIVSSDSLYIAAVGVSDLAIIESAGALVVVPRSRVEEIKKVVDHLKDSERDDIL